MPMSVARGASQGCAVWITGLPSSGKTTLAKAICSRLKEDYKCAAYNIDGDNLRGGLNSDLGFTDQDRRENIRRAAEVSKMIAEAGIICVASFISPFEQGRRESRNLHENAGIAFYEIYLSTPLEVCRGRDSKGFYAKAMRCELKDFTGVTSPYEIPQHPDLTLDTSALTVEESVAKVFDILRVKKCLSAFEISIPSREIHNTNCDELPLNVSLLTQKNVALSSKFDCNPKLHGGILDGGVENTINKCDTETVNSVTENKSGNDFNKSVDDKAASKQAKAMENALESDNYLEIGMIDVQWIQTIADGWAEPLEGFMREQDYLECLHFRSISREGKKFSQSIPIILTCSKEDKDRIEGQKTLPLVYQGKVVAYLENPEFYEFRKEEHCSRLYGTLDPAHPTIKHINESGDWLVGGELTNIGEIKWDDGLDKYRMSVAQIRKQVQDAEADCVIAFQLRNPLHNGHVLLIEEARRKLMHDGYRNVLVLLHPLGGWTKEDDVPLHVRVRQHEVYLQHSDWKNRTILAIFPSPMLYAGPVEVQWHAKARMVAGATHYIVGRDPAGVPHPTKGGYLYQPCHGAKVLSMTPYLGKLTILPFPVVAMCKSSNRMDFFDENRSHDYEFISGTKMRMYAKQNQEPPKGFMHEKAWAVLAEHYRMNNSA